MFIGSPKVVEREGRISPSSFYGKLPVYWSQMLALTTWLMSFIFLFLLFLPLRPTQQRVGWYNLVSVECLKMIKQMVVGFCWGLMLLCMLGVDFESTSAV